MKNTVLIGYCFVYAVLNVSGAAIIKSQLRLVKLENLQDWILFLFNFYVIAAFILIFASALAMFKALSEGNFSFAIPVATGINFIFTLIVGLVLFKDKINALTIMGFLLILSGILVLSLAKQFNTPNS
jgi:multidrug transporter EmrE-like cation transporter